MIANPDRTRIDGWYSCPKHKVHALEDCPMPDREFSAEDLRLIMAMCKSANPWHETRPMLPAWQSVYNTAKQQLGEKD
jgi:hypothetical protein